MCCLLHRIKGNQIQASEAQILPIAIADTSKRIRPNDETNQFFRVPDLRPTSWCLIRGRASAQRGAAARDFLPDSVSSCQARRQRCTACLTAVEAFRKGNVIRQEVEFSISARAWTSLLSSDPSLACISSRAWTSLLSSRLKLGLYLGTRLDFSA